MNYIIPRQTCWSDTEDRAMQLKRIFLLQVLIIGSYDSLSAHRSYNNILWKILMKSVGRQMIPMF